MGDGEDVTVRRRVRAATGSAVVALLVAAVGLGVVGVAGLGATGLAGRAEAAVVTGRVANTAGGCLENANNAAVVGNKLQLAACGTGVGQQWSRWADGTLRVQGGCADLRAGATAQNTAVVLMSCSATSTSQRWTVRSDGRLQNQKANLCLQPLNGRIVAANAATVASCTSGTAAGPQRWAVPALSTPTATTTTPKPTTTPPATTTPPTTPPTTTKPVTTVPPTTTTPPPAATALWDADVTRYGLSRFEDIAWNFQGAPAPTVVASPVTAGRKALQFTMPGGGQRTEIVPTTPDFTEGLDRWFGFSFVLPAGFPTDVESWQLLTQWKNDGTGSPPLEVTVGKGNLWLSGGWGHPAGPRKFSVPITAADTGRRIDLAFHIVFSRDPAKGVVDVYRDGQQVIGGFHPEGGTLYPASATTSLSSYWKMGIYRDTAITAPATYTIESAKFGTSLAAVGP